jgi:hypothetical protein
MSAYEELLERCATAYDNVLWGVFDGTPGGTRKMQLAASRAFLAEVRRTLETATPEMADAAFDSIFTADSEDDPVEMWLAMLHASPLEPPK